jgi:sugar/nucleoside kinase (ribokinase family)
VSTTTKPTDAAYDVLGIGNALVDVLGTEADLFLGEHDLVKGSMALIDTERAEELYAALGETTETSGGSAANTIAGVASFGGQAAFIGRIHDDALGQAFAHDLGELGVHFADQRATEGEPTGRCLIVVTPDGERTMSTYLGASATIEAADLDLDLIASASVTFLEGYLFDQPAAKEAFRAAATAAHGAGRKVALTLSDGFCVDRHRDDFVALVQSGVDVLFANEDEITKLYECGFDEAVARVRDACELAAITRGEHGSVIVSADEVLSVAAEPVAKVVDTTGAGDLYAAGFLYGLTQGHPLADCGRLGSLAAAAVIGHLGPRPGVTLAQLADS